VWPRPHDPVQPRAPTDGRARRSPSKAPAPGRPVASLATPQYCSWRSSCDAPTPLETRLVRNRRPLSLGTGVLSWTPGKAQASKCFRTSSTSRMLDVRGRLRCACNATSLSPPSEAAAPLSCPWVATPLRGRGGRISHPKSTRPRSCVAAAHTARCPELFPTRGSVAPSAPPNPNGQPHKHHSKPKIKIRVGGRKKKPNL
jgi:hypothetical protein